MSLTHQDLEVLSKPFPAKAHKFNQGLPYIHEVPVGQRLDAVDPSWEWHIVKIERRANAGQGGKDVGTVWVHVSLIVKGVRRDGVGMAVIQQTNPIEIKRWDNAKRENVGTGEFYTNEANEAEKSATTDAFKRAFRMFGGGRYLLAIPKDDKGKLTVANVNQLEAWLKANYGDIQDTPAYYDDDKTEDTGGESFIPPNVTSGNFSPSAASPEKSATGTGEKEQFTNPIKTVDVRVQEKDQSRYIVAGGLTFFGRDVFRALSFDDATIEKLDKRGAVTLPATITIAYSQNENGFKKPVRVRRDDTGEVIDMADLANKKAANQ